MSKYSKRLAKAKKNWETAKDERDQFESKVPSGNYKLQLQSAKLDESSKGNLMISREHVVVGGEYDAETVHDFMMVETEKGPLFILQWLDRLGLDVDEIKVEKLEGTLEDIVKDAPVCKGKVNVTEEGYVNVKILSLLENEEGDGANRDSDGDDGGDGGDDNPSCFGEFEDDVEDCQECGVAKECEKETDSGGGDEGGDDEDEQKTALINFCQAQDVEVDGEEVDDETEVDDMIKAIKDYEYDKGKLDEDELELLKEIGAEDCIIEKKKKEKKAKKPSGKKGKDKKKKKGKK